MLIADKVGFHRSSDTFETKQFSIKASAKAFSILSSSLYQNKIRAIIRELSCNAIDAQKAAKSNRNFEITLPTSRMPLFKIRDYGTGISPEDINKVYTTYFESTKTTSNDMIGCLGLGSKTPFCYTDNFAVSSYYNGKKYSYAATISEDGMPTIHLVMEEDTSEPNGLEVSFAVKIHDISSFDDEMRFVNFWLDTKPIFTKQGNLTPDFSAHAEYTKSKLDSLKVFECSVSGANVKIFKKDGYDYNSDKRITNGSYVIMGNVPYSLSLQNLPSLLPTERRLDVDGFLHIEVPIGEVEPQASRESLSYSKSTISYLEKVIKDALAKCAADFSKEIDSAPSAFDAWKIVFDKSRAFPYSAIAEQDIAYKDKTININKALSTTITGLSSYTKIYRRQFYRNGKTGFSVAKDVSGYLRDIFRPNEVRFISQASLESYVGRKNKGFDAGLNSLKNWILNEEVSGVSDKVFIVSTDEMIKTFELDKTNLLLHLDSLPAGQPSLRVQNKATSTRAGKKKTQVWHIKKVSNFSEAQSSDRSVCEIDFDDEETEFTYVVLEKNALTTADKKHTIFNWHTGLEFLGWKGMNLYGLTPTQLKMIEDKDNWLPLELRILDLIDEEFRTNLDKIKKEISITALADVLENRGNKLVFAASGNWDTLLRPDNIQTLLESLPQDHEIVKFAEKSGSLSAERKIIADTKASDVISRMLNSISFSDDFDLIHQKIKNEMQLAKTEAVTSAEQNVRTIIREQSEILIKYPLLALFSQSVGEFRREESLRSELTKAVAKCYQ